VTADPDGNSPARRLRREADRGEADELAPEARALLPPARPHDTERLVAPRATPRVVHAEELDLLAHPADARAQNDASRRQVIERREHLRREEGVAVRRSEEHTSELQSRFDLVCRLLL